MDKQMDQKLYAPDLSMWGHKKHSVFTTGKNLLQDENWVQSYFVSSAK